MESPIILPTKQGQICKIADPAGSGNPDAVYIVTDNPVLFDDDDSVQVVNLKDLQRNVRTPFLCKHIPVIKNDLITIADSLEEYIRSWNL